MNLYLPSILEPYLKGISEVWEIESKRLIKNGKSPYSIENKLIWFNILQTLYLGVIYHFLGSRVVLYHFIYSLLIVLMLETINYVEHYGLLRKKDKNGNYESVKYIHSWNAPQVMSNYLLFKVQRHSDHHANSYKPY